ncbi:proteinase inhibitor-like [Chironomus tepperi]|uniref:proteinase inhibitor-like n=1 Tax=Chironomus tepperi TaxID=113505 RepID=UPI00391F1D9D
MKFLFTILSIFFFFATVYGQSADCTSPPVTGRCFAYFPSWNYDSASNTCKPFVYGGCQGNGNRYETEAECIAKCAH